MPATLEVVLVLLACAVLVVVLARRFGLSPLLGYLLVGALVGPKALAWVPDAPATRYLGEFGVVFLMFSIGLEFSLPRLKAMQRTLFGLGLSQVALTTAGTALIAAVAGFGWQAGLVLGGALAMSSTAIVSKVLAERGELATPHGSAAMGILLFQDLAVVPLLIITTSLAKGTAGLALTLGLAALKAAAALSLILVFGQRLMRPWFHLVARSRSGELFVLNVLLVTLGLAWVTEMAGLSLALGAFLAGMLIAETEYRYQVEEDIKPFRDVLLGLFFVAIGMRLDLAQVAAHAGWVLLALAGPLAVKILLVVVLARLFGAGIASSIKAAFFLAPAGEFALVLIANAAGVPGLSDSLLQVVLAAMLLSMLLGSVLIQFADPIARRLTANDWLSRATEITRIAAQTMTRQEHVVICGYGRTGQNMARLLEQEGIPFIALDDDPERVREAAGDGSSVVFGDAGRREALLAAGLRRARALVITFTDVPVALRILHVARELRPELPVIVRTLDDSDLERLVAAGAAEVVPEVLEGSLMLATHSLLLLGVPLPRVLARVRNVREARYQLFRGFYHGATDHAEGAENLQSRLHSVWLTGAASSIGRTLGSLGLEGLVEVKAVRRRGVKVARIGPDLVLEEGDVVVILGIPENLALAERRLLQR